MKEKEYFDFLGRYEENSQFILRINRGNGPFEREVILKYSNYAGIKKPELYFIDGGNRFDYKSIGGIENIVSLEEIPDGMCWKILKTLVF